MYVNDRTLEPGREYLVYGDWLGATNAVSGPLFPETMYRKGSVPDAVSATTEIVSTESAKDDVAFLESALASPAAGTVFGRLQFVDPLLNSPPLPLSRILIRILDDDRRLVAETETREDGRFVAANLPAGLTWIEPRLPAHLLANRSSVEVRQSTCMNVYFNAIPNGRVRGQLLRDPPGALLVDLIPIDEGLAARSDARRTVESSDDGRFEFVGVPAGSYWLGVNLARPPDAGWQPYAPTFYPGTADPSSAKAVVVGQGTLHEGLDFALERELQRGVLEVRLPFDSGTYATICLWDSSLTFAQPGGVWRSAPDFSVFFGVLEGRRYHVAAHVEGASGHAESEMSRWSLTLAIIR